MSKSLERLCERRRNASRDAVGKVPPKEHLDGFHYDDQSPNMGEDEVNSDSTKLLSLSACVVGPIPAKLILTTCVIIRSIVVDILIILIIDYWVCDLVP